GAADGTRARTRHRRAGRLGIVAAAAPAHVPGHHRADAAVLCRQPVHFCQRRPAQWRRAGAARRPGRSCQLCRSVAAGAGADRHRHRFCHHGTVPGRAADLAWPDRHRSCRWRGWPAMSAHLAIAPILIPLATAALQLLTGSRHWRLRAFLSLASCLLLVLVAIALLCVVVDPGTTADRTLVYNLGSWPAHLAIVLVVDRLAVLMLLLTAVLALTVMPYALGRWRFMGVFMQPLMQLLLVGFNGSFLTGDLFNLFVFFEVLLAASYGLALYGSGPRRVSASLHYIVINLAASLLFLLGVSLIYAATGSLNMAVLARLLPTMSDAARTLLHVGAALLGMAFLIKAAVWPLGFWLPRTYGAATPPVAALFALMTKLGVYVLLRLSLLLFGAGAGAASAHFGSDWLLWAGIVTLVVGSIGMLG